MSEVRLSWSGDRLQFVSQTGYGALGQLGGAGDGPSSEPSDRLPEDVASCAAYDVVVLQEQSQELQTPEAVIDPAVDLSQRQW